MHKVGDKVGGEGYLHINPDPLGKFFQTFLFKNVIKPKNREPFRIFKTSWTITQICFWKIHSPSLDLQPVCLYMVLPFLPGKQSVDYFQSSLL